MTLTRLRLRGPFVSYTTRPLALSFSNTSLSTMVICPLGEWLILAGVLAEL